jgi:hypothetical protein
VLQVEPAPQVDNKRDGQRTELLVSGLLEQQLPPGWSMYTQASAVIMMNCVCTCAQLFLRRCAAR